VAGKGVTITLDPEARAWLARKGFDRAFGARPMARLIDRVVKKPLSDRLLFGSLAKGGAIRIAVEDDAIVVVEDGAGGA
jgi:ATP-dependent Clp protease ATP-binding subunit ClpA